MNKSIDKKASLGTTKVVTKAGQKEDGSASNHFCPPSWLDGILLNICL